MLLPAAMSAPGPAAPPGRTPPGEGSWRRCVVPSLPRLRSAPAGVARRGHCPGGLGLVQGRRSEERAVYVCRLRAGLREQGGGQGAPGGSVVRCQRLLCGRGEARGKSGWGSRAGQLPRPLLLHRDRRLLLLHHVGLAVGRALGATRGFSFSSGRGRKEGFSSWELEEWWCVWCVPTELGMITCSGVRVHIEMRCLASLASKMGW